MIDWFLALEVLEQTAVAGVIIALAGVIVAFLHVLMQFFHNKKTGENASQIVVILQNNHPDTSISPQEIQSIKPILQKLVTSQEKQESFHDLSEGRIQQAIDRLERLKRQQSQNPKGQKQELIDTKLELAAIYTFSDAEKSRGLLQEVIAIEPDHYQANNLYALLLMRLGDVEQARDIFENMEKLSRQNQDVAKQSVFLGNLGTAYASLGQVDKAIDYHQQALKISRETKDRQGEGAHLNNLGLAYVEEQVDKAIDHYKQALKINREIRDEYREGFNLGNLGTAYHRLGDFNKAKHCHQQALKISRKVKCRQGEGNDLGNLGLAYLDLVQVEKAIDYFQQALKISREIKDLQGEGNHLNNLGAAYARLDDVGEAIDYLQLALGIFEKIGSPSAEQTKTLLEKLQQPHNK